MPDPDSGLPSRPRLADRLAAARRNRFVGRAGEIELFRTALLEEDPPFCVLHVYGPGGVGKTALLYQYARVAAESGATAVLLDGRNIDPLPRGFLLALGAALGLAEGDSPLDALARHRRAVLLIDTYETLEPLDGWLRETFLPQLPDQSLVVIAGRNPPGAAWRTDPGWRDLVRIVSLRNLRPEESRTYLRARALPEAYHAEILELTHGHPLALALVADLMAQTDAQTLERGWRPDVVALLLERFVTQVPSPRHRLALQLCAHARVTTEALLADVLGPEDAHDLFTWLRGLSFIEQGPDGLFPHDLVRDVLEADLRWRNPDDYRSLHKRIRRSIIRRTVHTQGVARQRMLFDLLHLHRNQPLVQPYYDWSAMGATYAEAAAPDDAAGIIEMARLHEGEESARIVAHWLQRQPEAFVAFRSSDVRLVGFVANIAIDALTEEDLASDPAARTALDYTRRYGPLRSGERAIFHRFWMARDAYQTPWVHNLVAVVATNTWAMTPRLAWTFAAVADADFWEPMFTYLNIHRAREADFTVGGHRYGVFVHDWRTEPFDTWLEIMGERELADDFNLPTAQAVRPAPLVVLSQPDFADATRRALRDYTRPAALAANPLLRSRVVVDRGGEGADPSVLQAVLREAVEALRTNPRDEKLYRAVWHTYLEPAPTQEAAAELLDLPFSTYRRHLATGIDRVTEWLWHRELYGGQAR